MESDNISKAVATASALYSSGSLNKDVFLKNNSYRKTINETLSNKNTSMILKYSSAIPLLSRRRHSLDKKQRNRKPKLYAELSDELVRDIPDERLETDHGGPTSVFSLFQGFNATLPEVNEEIERIKKGSSKLLEGGFVDKESRELDDPNRDPLPAGITESKIKHSQNPHHLKQFKAEIDYKLDLLEIRKGLTANEIQEIDIKLEKLHKMRASVFNKIALYERDEIALENYLDEIESRLSLIKDIDPDLNETDESSEEDEDAEDVEPDPKSENLMMNQSVYGRLTDEHHKKSRKIKPTLQQYYEPGSNIAEFHGHEDTITTFGFDLPFGTMVSASLDNTVRVWDLSRSKCIGLLEGHNAAVKCLQIEDSTVVTGSLDASIKMWDLNRLHNEEQDPLIHSFDSHVDEITALHFNNNTLISGSNDKTIRQWDMTTGHCLQTIDVLWASSMMNASSGSYTTSSPVVAAEQSSFIGSLQCYDAALATGTADGLVRLWDLRSGEVIRQLSGHTGPVTCLQFDDKHLITGSSDRSIRIWDLRTGNIVDAFVYDTGITSLQFDSRRIISTNGDSVVKVYDRIEEKHWDCGPRVSDPSSEVNIIFARYQEGYMVEGRTDGAFGVWAI
ncbi:Mitochondrial fission protein [Komagataella phaffii CBS 7435]|uniref:Peripheral protein of the cytosolic face of the mitochondrial outer membrane, required for mitochond n=2 Tax=Komagataella phaffii TaxID=460519 RepID=C4QZK7_KOMPG|nr:Peripheral protein of the cytosolic face of the mitochondrial outer membrane, required for mitochond [Komagataella phaffii GS115]AOA62659.1 GQ67_00103T0 [Komagataella phaffii]CAH2448824.1 Mitochondrial fission protein [Komagataella phaffii CBS 7435]AOA68155.1 GQ68_01284T0 [Komagataella phaffii GS115]CAY68681.1 Peripheral protein of the cytosolic face of the mitochondrial outer membrane, required for mitochond [Komagataella phaffii GS115]CCA38905.1 Mitochondrial fission protein [Komagataella